MVLLTSKRIAETNERKKTNIHEIIDDRTYTDDLLSDKHILTLRNIKALPLRSSSIWDCRSICCWIAEEYLINNVTHDEVKRFSIQHQK